ncbi:L-aspartate oxidase [Leptolyngbya valderiana BDU 20041]|nr:L-aspartate oxidase [Geitlerinema sp. CS-897]OAB61057.1 L-aspartate oxidase [Leptolyngbya valderiana BDU 20041]
MSSPTFEVQSLPTLPSSFDAIVVGSGAAGLYAALCLPDSLNVGLLTKDEIPLSASDWAQGGIAAAVAEDDSPKLHIEDTLKAGAGLCDKPAVEFLAERAPDCIRSLVELGVSFDRQDNRLALTLEAAHSRRRVLHAADTTGRAVVSTLGRQVARRPNITPISRAFVLDLWLDETGRCQGVGVLYRGEIRWIEARAVVLATGGGGRVFAKTTNPSVSTGDGVALAWRAGAIVRDLEFFQFHPTALMKPGAPRFLISEAVRGEGAHLVDAEGRRFAFDYHPEGELAPRDVVSRSIFNYLRSTGLDPAEAHVWLDFRSIPEERIRKRFPNIVRVCRQWGVDVFSEPVPVAPAAHYWMGGIATDLQGRTSIEGLYAVGETASTGVHGANRLASNSLLECIVFGAQLGHLELLETAIAEPPPATQHDAIDLSGARGAIEQLRHDLPRLVWQSAGISRDARTLEFALDRIAAWKAEFAASSLSRQINALVRGRTADVGADGDSSSLLAWGETRNLLDIAELILKSAAFRTESRGGHYRSDFPHSDPQWRVHTLGRGDRLWCSSVLEDDRGQNVTQTTDRSETA